MGTMTVRAPSERRRHARKPKAFTVRFRSIGGEGKRDSADRMGRIVNVSRGGVLLLSKRQMSPGTVIALKFPPNIFSGGAATLHGVVRRLDPETDTGDHPMGLMFVRISDTPAPPIPGKRPSKERRRAPREIQRLTVQIVCGSFGAPPGEGDIRGVLTNVSRGGIELTTTHPFPPGAALEVKIPKSSLGPGRTASGSVVWMMEGDQVGRFRMGVQLD